MMNEALVLTFEAGRWGGDCDADLEQDFRDEVERLGFRHFLFCTLGSSEKGSTLIGSRVLVTSADDATVRSLVSLFDFRLSSAARRPIHGFEPFHWQIGAQSDPARNELNHSGFCLPMRSGNGQSGYLVVFGAETCGPRDFSRLIFASLEWFSCLIETLTSPSSGVAGLTARELDCLRWTAEGKTSGEIAMIIKLSEHTVNHYLIAASRKLDCVNRVQAVAKALRLGLFL